MNRRALLRSSAMIPVAAVLARCAGQTLQTVSAQILADAQGLQATSQSIMSAVMAYDPNAISASVQSQITGAEAALTNALKSLSTSTPAASATSTLQNVGNALTAVFQAIAVALPAASMAFPQIAAIVPIYDAAVALLPGVIAYVNSIVAQFSPTPTAGVMAMPPQVRAIKETSLPPNAARSRLGIPVLAH